MSGSEKSTSDDDDLSDTPTERDSSSESEEEEEDQCRKDREPGHRASAGAKTTRNETMRRMATQMIGQSTHMFKLNKLWLEELIGNLDQVHIRLNEAKTALAAGGSSRRRHELTKILDHTSDLITATEKKLKKEYTRYKQNQEAFKPNVQRATSVALSAGAGVHGQDRTRSHQKRRTAPGQQFHKLKAPAAWTEATKKDNPSLTMDVKAGTTILRILALLRHSSRSTRPWLKDLDLGNNNHGDDDKPKGNAWGLMINPHNPTRDTE